MVVIKQVEPGPGSGDTRSSKSRISSRACHRCRLLHKKCDIRSRGKTCSNCDISGALCKGGGNSELQIRFSELSYTSPKPRGTAHRSSSRVRPQHNPPNNTCLVTSHNDERVSEDPNNTSLVEAIGVTIRPINERSLIATSSTQTCFQTIHSFHPDAESSFQNLGFISPDGTQQPGYDETYTLGPNNAVLPWPWPLSSDEAKLVKHFSTFLMPWFDYCWASAPFKSFLQSRIRNDPGILFAVLAVSARHLEAVGSEDCNSNEYERRCLAILIPTLNQNDTARSQDALLVSALLLRLLDEMTDPSDRRPVIRHTVSAPLLKRIRQNDPDPSELSTSAMTIVLRQEIYVANMTKRPVELAGYDCGIDDSLEPAIDVMWTCRMMSHAAKVTNYAYGNESRIPARWDQLWLYLEEWDHKKPPSFSPMNMTSGGYNQTNLRRGVFPEIYYLYDCPIASQQYLELCKIILLANDPRTPALGLGRTNYVRAQEERIREAVRTVCGIWLSNPEYIPARVVAGLVIGMTGELFQSPFETAKLLKILSEAELHVGWPCLKVSPHLREFWAVNSSAMVD